MRRFVKGFSDHLQVYICELLRDPIGVLEFGLRTTVGQGQAFHAGGLRGHNAEGRVLDGQAFAGSEQWFMELGKFL